MEEENSNFEDIKKSLHLLRKQSKHYTHFRDLINKLEEASATGLENSMIESIVQIVINAGLSVVNNIALIKCMIPQGRIDDDIIKRLVAWYFSGSGSVKLNSILIQWFIGCWEYQLIDRSSMYIFYDSFFYTMLKQEGLESRLAQIIYLMTKPEDVTRRQVTRLLRLNAHYRRSQKHLIALLSLFKSYKPEVVPEKILTINIQSVWRPIPEHMRINFEHARDRIISKQGSKPDEHYSWNIFYQTRFKKIHEYLTPSVSYFSIGSSIFNNKVEKSIFDVADFTALGRYQSNVKLPCNAMSLLSNSIGYHLLTFTNSEYQQRFMHNLYYTFWRSFVFENGRYSDEELNKILDMTMDFSRYMQHGISIVTYFVNEYLSYCMDEYNLKMLSLMQWSTISVQEIEEYVLKHMKLMFHTSSLRMKCKIIKTLRMLILNHLIINDETFKDKTFPFFGQNFIGQLTENVKIIEEFAKDLILSGLNTHLYDSIIVSEALTFYEHIDALEIYKKTTFTALGPPAVIYGSFLNRSCALISRLCALLLHYRKYFKDHRERVSMSSIKWLIVYAEDLVSALWYDNCFSKRIANNRYFLRHVSDSTVTVNSQYDINTQLNINQHYAFLPYMYTLNITGLQIKTKKDASNVAVHYYNYVHQFISALLGN